MREITRSPAAAASLLFFRDPPPTLRHDDDDGEEWYVERQARPEHGRGDEVQGHGPLNNAEKELKGVSGHPEHVFHQFVGVAIEAAICTCSTFVEEGGLAPPYCTQTPAWNAEM